MDQTRPDTRVITNGANSARRNRILVTIAVFKFFKSAALILTGCLALTFRNTNFSKLATYWINRYRVDPNNKYVDWALNHAQLVRPRQLELLAAGTFVYAILFLVEGIGLYKGKVWAEYLVIVEVCLLMPVEIMEICKKPDLIRFGLLIANILILIYLIYLRITSLRNQRRALRTTTA